ncbi:MAG: hypothetical protein M1827_004428 [Pycnora praestabilis]|nr:MAG: hypothetical protein M1827_004428 [Pycnora praestabilis]
MAPKPSRGEYIETDTGNKVSRRSQITGTQNIILGGKTVIQADCTIRGDLVRTLPFSSSKDGTPTKPSSNVAVSIGRYCFLSKSSTLRPPSKLHHGVFSYYPLKIGDHVFVGEGAVLEAAVVGNYVSIGKGAVVGKFAILRDWVKVLEGAVVPGGMVVPTGSVVGGRPARVVEEVGSGWGITGGPGGDLRELWRSVG